MLKRMIEVLAGCEERLGQAGMPQLVVGLLALTQMVPVMRPATLPRLSPELVVTQPNGAETRLSSFKGKVVAVEFLFVRSPHCLQLAQMLNRLHSELGGRGFQPLAVTFGPSADLGILNSLVDHLKLTYPVGLTTSDQVDAYLGRAGKEILKIPQMVIVDRNGVIRATSGTQGDPALESESTLRPLLETLLKNSASPAEPSHHGDAEAVNGDGRSEPAPPDRAQALRAAADRKAAPDFTLQDMRGVAVRLADYRGRVVLLNFWATWCGPCKTEIPWFQEFGAAYQDRGFAVLGVAMDEDGLGAVKLYAGRQKRNYRILLGNQQVARRYGGIAALPETLLIDREGRIAAEHVGLVSKRRYEEEIGELLGLRAEDEGLFRAGPRRFSVSWNPAKSALSLLDVP